MALLAEEFEVFYYYLVLCLFVYNNSIRLINDTDPQKYAKNSRETQQNIDEVYHEKMQHKEEYLEIIDYFNAILNKTL